MRKNLRKLLAHIAIDGIAICDMRLFLAKPSDVSNKKYKFYRINKSAKREPREISNFSSLIILAAQRRLFGFRVKSSASVCMIFV